MGSQQGGSVWDLSLDVSVGKAQPEVSVRMCQLGRLCLGSQLGCVSWEGSV